MPYDCRLVGVELDKRSVKVEHYKHIDRCIYLLGAEDSGITTEARNKCHQLVQLPIGNYNVANAGSIIMYDRYLKSALAENFNNVLHNVELETVSSACV